MNKVVCWVATGIIGLLSAVSLFAADNVGHARAGIVNDLAEASPGALALWYRQPADKWVEALPMIWRRHCHRAAKSNGEM